MHQLLLTLTYSSDHTSDIWWWTIMAGFISDWHWSWSQSSSSHPIQSHKMVNCVAFSLRIFSHVVAVQRKQLSCWRQFVLFLMKFVCAAICCLHDQGVACWSSHMCRPTLWSITTPAGCNYNNNIKSRVAVSPHTRWIQGDTPWHFCLLACTGTLPVHSSPPLPV